MKSILFSILLGLSGLTALGQTGSAASGPLTRYAAVLSDLEEARDLVTGSGGIEKEWRLQWRQDNDVSFSIDEVIITSEADKVEPDTFSNEGALNGDR